MIFFQSHGGKGTKTRIESCCSFGKRLGIEFGGADSWPILGEMTVYGLVGGRSALGRVIIG